MRLTRIGNTDIVVHPLLIVVAAGACVLGRLYGLLQAILALVMHEACHTIVANAFGCRVDALELMPFGCVARLKHVSLTPHAEWCTAIAGPIAGFVIAGAAAMTGQFFPRIGARIQPFLLFNLTIALINLLPAMPLDGGRVVKCVLEGRIGLTKAVKVTAWAGVALGTLMLLGTVLLALLRMTNLTLPVMGLFLVIAAVRELRLLPEKQLAVVWRRSDALSASALPVHEVAACASICATAWRNACLNWPMVS